MSLEILIMNREDAGRATHQRKAPPTAIISITDIHSPPNKFKNPPWLRAVLPLKFEDVYRGRGCMTPAQAREVRDFVLEVVPRVRRLIVHCEYGVSRSSGTAAAIRQYLTGGGDVILNDPRYSPNHTCYDLVLAALEGKAEDAGY